MRVAHRSDERLVVFHQLAQHVARRDEGLVVILETLQLYDMLDGADGAAADFANALRHSVCYGGKLRCLFVEQLVIVAKMRSADVPVKILGLYIERKRVREQRI